MLAPKTKLQVGNFISLPKILQIIPLNKTDTVKSKLKSKMILKFQHRFKIHSTQLNRRLFTRNYFGLKVQFLYQNLQIFFIEIFKVKIGFSPEPMNDIFEF